MSGDARRNPGNDADGTGGAGAAQEEAPDAEVSAFVLEVAAAIEAMNEQIMDLGGDEMSQSVLRFTSRVRGSVCRVCFTLHPYIYFTYVCAEINSGLPADN